MFVCNYILNCENCSAKKLSQSGTEAVTKWDSFLLLRCYKVGRELLQRWTLQSGTIVTKWTVTTRKFCNFLGNNNEHVGYQNMIPHRSTFLALNTNTYIYGPTRGFHGTRHFYLRDTGLATKFRGIQD